MEVYCTECGQKSDRGMIQRCRRCSGMSSEGAKRMCDDCGEEKSDVEAVFLRVAGTATLYDMKNAFDLCLDCRRKRRGAYRMAER